MLTGMTHAGHATAGDAAPPEAFHRLQEFVNTNDIEEGRDLLGTPERLRDWLADAGRIPPGARISAEQHARTLAVREGLRALGRINNGEALEPDRLAAMNAATAQLPLVASVAPLETWQLTPAGRGVDGYLAEIVATLVAAMADGSWSRVKACRNDTCRWLFFDESRNRSGTWCSMAICGSRAKARAYRARRRSAPVAGA
jgi:predicted RNA-binding Zn ribbon-like protein